MAKPVKKQPLTPEQQSAVDLQFVRERNPHLYFGEGSRGWIESMYLWQRAFMKSQAGIRILRTNNQAGKTLTGSRDFAYFLLRDHPWRKLPGKQLLRGRIVTDATLVDANIIPYLKTVLPMARVKTEKLRKPYEAKWTIYADDLQTVIAEFDIMTYEQDATEFSGVQLDILWFDEPPPRAIWVESYMRFTATEQNIIITMTPLLSAGYFVDEVENNPGLDVEVIVARPGDCPHITAAVLAGIEAAISDPDERQARLEAQYMQLAGLVFKSFRETDFVIPEGDYHRLADGGSAPVVCSLDPHGAKHPFVVWTMTDEQGYPLVLDCLPEGRWDREPHYHGGLTGVVAMIKQREQQYGYRVTRRMIDPRAGRTTIANDVQIRELYRRAGMWFDLADTASEPDTRNVWIRNSLSFDVHGKPKLRVSRRAGNVIMMFARFAYDVKAMRQNENKDRVLYIETWKDPADTLGYGLSALPNYSTGVKLQLEPEKQDYFKQKTVRPAGVGSFAGMGF